MQKMMYPYGFQKTGFQYPYGFFADLSAPEPKNRMDIKNLLFG